jgi:hypothetical protein
LDFMLALLLVCATNITKLYFAQVDGIEFLVVKQACKFAKDHDVSNGPIVSNFCYLDAPHIELLLGV